MAWSTGILANAGTAILWASFFHLVFGNAIIGIVEGLLIARVFRQPASRSIGWMIVANYASCIVGLFLAGNGESSSLAEPGGPIRLLGPVPLFEVQKFLLIMLAVSLLLTIIVEWPFVFWIFRRQPSRWRRATVACVLAQLVSYAILVPYYLFHGVNSLGSGVRVARSLDAGENSRASVLFIAGDGSVHRIRLDGSPSVRILEPTVETRDEWTELCIEPSEDGRTGDLYAWYMQPQPNGGRASAPRELMHAVTLRPPNSPIVPREMHDYRPAGEADRGWSFNTAGWHAVGLYGVHANRTDRMQVALALPFASWQARCANVLPNDQVVFEWGGQIVLYDRPRNQIAFIAFGRAPAVILDDLPTLSRTQPATQPAP